jgi:hypothetical protein
VVEGLIEGQDASAHVVDIFPFPTMSPVAEPDFVTRAGGLEASDRRFGLDQVEVVGALLNWLGRKSINDGWWLDRIKGRKPRLVVAVAFANKMARTIRAIATKKELYRDPELSLTAG